MSGLEDGSQKWSWANRSPSLPLGVLLQHSQPVQAEPQGHWGPGRPQGLGHLYCSFCSPPTLPLVPLLRNSTLHKAGTSYEGSHFLNLSLGCPQSKSPLERVPKHHRHLFLQSTLSQKMKFEKFSQVGLSLETTALLESFRVTQ